MPALLLGARDAARFEVIGTFGVVGDQAVTHASILANASPLAANVDVHVFDMGPPLRTALPNPMSPHVVGWLALTREQDERLDAWLNDMQTRTSACQYIALPAEERVVDPTTGRTVSWKFSCAGFVQCAYREGAGITAARCRRTAARSSAATSATARASSPSSTTSR